MMKPTTGYVLGQFPSLTETFILREIQALVYHGLTMRVFAIYGTRVPGFQPLPVTTLYAPARWSRPVLAHFLQRMVAAKTRRDKRLGVRGEAAVEAWKLVLQEHPEIVHLHAHFAYEPALIAMQLAQATGLPFSFSAHAWDIYCSATPLNELIAAAEFVTTCTVANVKHLKTIARTEDRHKIILIRHGINLEQLEYAERPTPEQLRCTAIGRLVKKKGFDYLMQAMSELKRRGIPAECHIIGDGPERKMLVRLRKQLDLTDCVHLHGALSHQETLAHLRASYALIVPSVITPEGDRDGLPNVILEAAACGVPVIASDLPGIVEFVEDGVTGLIAPAGNPQALADRIESLFRQWGAMCADLCRAARRKVEEEYDIVKNVIPLLALFPRNGRLSGSE